MSKSWKATKRDLHEYCKDKEYDEQWTADWKLTRHPNSKKKHRNVFRSLVYGHMFGSVRQMCRKAAQKEKQSIRQKDRTHRKIDTKNIIDKEINIENNEF